VNESQPHPRPSFWSNVAAVAYKEATVLRHDKAVLATVLIQPIIMLLLFGGALSNQPANVPWVILDQSRSADSRRLIQSIQVTGFFLEPGYVASYDEGQALLKHGNALAFLVIPSDLRRQRERNASQVQLFVDGSDPLSAARVAGYIGQIAAAFDGNRADPRATRPGAFEVRQRFWFNPTLSDSWFFLAGLAGMLLTNLCLSATSLGLVGERENGTYEQMLASPTRPLELVLGKLLPFVGIAYFVLFFALISAGLVFGYWWRGSLLTLAIITLPFVLASLSIGVFVSTMARTSAQAVFITVFFILPSFVLSGSMLPYQLMPDGVREIGALFPLRWYQIALRRVVARGGDLFDVVVPLLALAGLFAFFLMMIRWRMKPRLG